MVMVCLKSLAYLRPVWQTFSLQADDDFETLGRFRFFDVVFGRLDGLQGDSLASASPMRKDAVLDRVVFGAVRWIAANANLQAQSIRERLQVFFEDGL
jgi:hypothetical protein